MNAIEKFARDYGSEESGNAYGQNLEAEFRSCVQSAIGDKGTVVDAWNDGGSDGYAEWHCSVKDVNGMAPDAEFMLTLVTALDNGHSWLTCQYDTADCDVLGDAEGSVGEFDPLPLFDKCLRQASASESKKSEDMLSRRDAMEKAKQIVSSLKPSASACKAVGLSLAQVKKAFADFNKAYNSKSYVGMSTYDFGDLLSNVANYAYVGGDNSGAMEIMDLAKSALSESKQSKGCSMKRKIESLAKKKPAAKKNESVYGTVRVDSEDIAIKVQEVNTYPSTSGASLTAEVPTVEAWFNDLSEFKDCVDGLAENCNGYADISRDGSDILVLINAPKDDESGDYEVIVELRCSTKITHASLEGVVDLLNNA